MDSQADKARSAPLHVTSAVIILCMDWLMFALNLLKGARSVLAIAAGGAALCTALVLWVERSRGASAGRHAAEKALLAGVAVAVPLPVMGSALGGIALIWALITGSGQRSKARASS